MPRYDYSCPKCGHTHEINVRAEWRDTLKLECPVDGTRLERAPAAGMAVVWGGKFQSPSIKKTGRDGDGSEW
ncbi:MAG: zinc ribbon domain-containing protein [Thermoleophilia bacterium]